ncbi:MAG: ArsR family transcriptional regulator [Candidatus Bathyarchaeota archaeon]
MQAVKVVADPDNFKLLADETRRKIIFLLRATEMTVTQIASNLKTSRQTIYHHIEKLQEAGLVYTARTEQVGHLTESYYRATAEAFYCSVGSTPGGHEFFQNQVKTVLESLRKLGFKIDYTDADVDRLVEIQSEQDYCCEMADLWDAISHLDDIDEKTKTIIEEFAKQLVMTNDEFQYLQAKKREFREFIQSLQTEV